MEKQQTRFTLRIDADLFERIKIIANKNKRSAAKQIEFMLETCISQFEKNN